MGQLFNRSSKTTINGNNPTTNANNGVVEQYCENVVRVPSQLRGLSLVDLRELCAVYDIDAESDDPTRLLGRLLARFPNYVLTKEEFARFTFEELSKFCQEHEIPIGSSPDTLVEYLHSHFNDTNPCTHNISAVHTHPSEDPASVASESTDTNAGESTLAESATTAQITDTASEYIYSSPPVTTAQSASTITATSDLSTSSTVPVTTVTATSDISTSSTVPVTTVQSTSTITAASDTSTSETVYVTTHQSSSIWASPNSQSDICVPYDDGSNISSFLYERRTSINTPIHPPFRFDTSLFSPGPTPAPSPFTVKTSSQLLEPSTAIPPFHVDNEDEPNVPVHFAQSETRETNIISDKKDDCVEFQGGFVREMIISPQDMDASVSEEDSVSHEDGSTDKISTDETEDSKSTPKKRKRTTYLAERAKVRKTSATTKKRKSKKSASATKAEGTAHSTTISNAPNTVPAKGKRKRLDYAGESDGGRKRQKLSADKFFRTSLPVSINGTPTQATPVCEADAPFSYVGSGEQRMEIDGKMVKLKWVLDASIVDDDE